MSRQGVFVLTALCKWLKANIFLLRPLRLQLLILTGCDERLRFSLRFSRRRLRVPPKDKPPIVLWWVNFYCMIKYIRVPWRIEMNVSTEFWTGSTLRLLRCMYGFSDCTVRLLIILNIVKIQSTFTRRTSVRSRSVRLGRRLIIVNRNSLQPCRCVFCISYSWSSPFSSNALNHFDQIQGEDERCHSNGDNQKSVRVTLHMKVRPRDLIDIFPVIKYFCVISSEINSMSIW